MVPEATSIDNSTIDKLIAAKEDDLYLSDISPLGIPFNSLRYNSKDIEKLSLINKGRPGSVCPKKFATFNTEFTDKGICIASHQYQSLKIKELDKKNLSPKDYKIEYNKIVEKSCICVGLGTSALLANDLDTKTEGKGISICPGPNMAYFAKKMSLKEISDHIYGRLNVITRTDRPNMFVKELKIYIDYLKNKIEETKVSRTVKQEKYFLNFANNLKEGVNYYQNLFSNLKENFKDKNSGILSELNSGKKTLQNLYSEIKNLSIIK